MDISKLTALLLATVFLSGCEKELDFEYQDIDPILVIEGVMTPSGAKVSIMMTTPMDKPMDTSYITDAIVVISDLTEKNDIYLNPTAEGIYTTDSPGLTGHIYELRIEYGSRTFYSSSLMLPIAEITKLEFNWIKMPYDHVAVLQVSFKDNQYSFGDCYWVRLYRNGEAYMWGIVKDSLESGGIIDTVFMTSRMDLSEEDEQTALYDGDIITVSVTPISKDMYNYLEAISNGSNGQAMFSGDKCLGYFLASTQSIMSITFHPNEINYYN